MTPFEFCDEIWQQKTRIAGLLEGEEITTLAFFVLIQYRRVTDRRTDRRTDGQTRCCRKDPRYNSVTRIKSKQHKTQQTKLAWFNRLLRQSARKRGGFILQCSRAHRGHTLVLPFPSLQIWSRVFQSRVFSVPDRFLLCREIHATPGFRLE